MIRTYVDSSVLIEAHRALGPLAGLALAVLNDPNRRFVTSEFVRLEVLPKAAYYQRVAEVRFYNEFFAVVTRSVAITRSLVNLALQRAEAFGLSAVDALHRPPRWPTPTSLSPPRSPRPHLCASPPSRSSRFIRER